ncbi:MAG: MoxR family ATPase [Candidimonas sp.]
MTQTEENMTRTSRPSAIRRMIEKTTSKKRPIFIWGPPGIGKSDIVWQIGRDQGRPVIDIRLLLMDPTDIRGIPYYSPASGKMEWAPPTDLPSDPESNAIVFLDEMNAAPQAVQGAAYQLILNRRVGTYTLPESSVIVAAGNRETDKAVSYRMPSALSNRFVHVEMKHDYNDWHEWALNNNIDPSVIGFLGKFPAELNTFNPKTSSRAFATPRSWSFVSELIDPEMSESDQTDLICGCIGEGSGLKFSKFLTTSMNLPNPMDILQGKIKEFHATDPSLAYNLGAQMTYLMRDIYQNYKQNTQSGEDMPKDYYEKANAMLVFMMNNFDGELTVWTAKTYLSHMKLPIKPNLVPSWKAFSDRYGNAIRGRETN